MAKPPDDLISISRQELEHILSEIEALEQMIGEIVRWRHALTQVKEQVEETIDLVIRKHVDMRMLRMRLNILLKNDPDKTPVRPPSQQDMQAAFKASGEFEAVRRGSGDTAKIPVVGRKGRETVVIPTVDPNDPTRKK